MNEPWLSDDELYQFTGYRRTTRQVGWLLKNNVKHYVNALNKVRVPRDAIGVVPSAQRQRRKTEPDFTKVRRAS
jgi:hypothetical protein